MHFLENAIELDIYLVSDYPDLVELGDYLYQEVSDKIKLMNKYKSKETLKLILINLYIGYQSRLAIRYSRDKSEYSRDRRYGQVFFKYDRVIPIIDTLKYLGYIHHWKGFSDREKDFYRQSRMIATPKLIELFHKYKFKKIDFINKLPPTEIIQLRDKDKNLIDYKDDRTTEIIRENLNRYNKFIEKQLIEVILTEDVKVNLYFLQNLIYYIANTSIDITELHTKNGQEIYGGAGKNINNSKQINNLNNNNKYPININIYYINHISNIIQYTINYHNTPISMTNTEIEITKEYQALINKNNDHGKDLSQKRSLSDYRIYQLNFVSKYQHLHRVFNNGWFDYGGRFYGGIHIGLPKEVREHITINDFPTVELDYSALHIRMLYHVQDIPYQEDPYTVLCGDDKEERGIYKKVLLVSINAETEEKAIKAIREELIKDGIRCQKTDKFIKGCIEKFKEFHQPIAKYLNVGMGLTLQYQDSLVTDKILTRMVKEGIPCLPIHDSFIVPEECEKPLYDVMVEAYKEVNYGFSPIIKKVE